MNEVPVMAVIRNFRIEFVVAAFSTYCYLKRTEKFPFKCIGMVCGNNHSNREKMKHEHKFKAILLNTHVVIYACMYVDVLRRFVYVYIHSVVSILIQLLSGSCVTHNYVERGNYKVPYVSNLSNYPSRYIRCCDNSARYVLGNCYPTSIFTYLHEQFANVH